MRPEAAPESIPTPELHDPPDQRWLGRVFAALLILGLAVAGRAQEPEEAGEGSAAELSWADHVVVTATRVEERVGEIPAHVTVLTRQEIAHSPSQTVDDLLRQIPGFSLFRRSSSLVAHPTSQGVSLRGIGPSGVSRTLVLLDGIPLNDPFGGWVYWSKVPLEHLEQIEVVRGGGSNVWGNYALGGVINLITRTPHGKAFNVFAQVGNRDTVQLDVSGGTQSDRLGFLLQGSYFETGGYKTIREDQRGAIDIDADSRHGAFSGKLDVELSPSATFFLRGQLFDEDRGNGTPLTNNGTEAGYLGVGSRLTTRGGSEWSLSLFGHRQTFDSTFSAQQSDRSSERPALDQFDVPSTAVGTSVQWSKGLEKQGGTHVVTAGSDLRWIDGETNEDFRFIAGSFANRRTAGGEQQLGGLYLQDNFSSGGRWQLQVGGRLDLWRSRDGFRIERNQATGEVLRSEAPPDREETTFSPKLAALYEVSERLRLRGSLYRAFRAPTVNELFRPFRVRNDITEANAALDPETLVGTELGLDYQTASLRSRLVGFWNEMDDPIANVTLAPGPGVIAPCGFVPPGGTCRQRQNLDRTRIRGLEALLELRPHRSWMLSGSYLYSDAEILRAPNQPELEGKRIAQVPRQQLVVKVTYSNPSAGDASVQTRFVDDQFEDDLNTRTLEEFVVVDLFLSRRLKEGWDVFVGAENLFDRTYEVGETADGLVSVGTPFLIHGGFRFRLKP